MQTRRRLWLRTLNPKGYWLWKKLNHIFRHVADEYFMNLVFFSSSSLSSSSSFPLHAGVSAALTEALPSAEVIKSVRRGSRTTQRPSWSRPPGPNIIGVGNMCDNDGQSGRSAMCVFLFFCKMKFESEWGRIIEGVGDPPPSSSYPRRTSPLLRRNDKYKFCRSFPFALLLPPPLTRLRWFLQMCSRLKQTHGMEVSRAVKVHLDFHLPSPPFPLYRAHINLKKILKNGIRKNCKCAMTTLW